MVFRPILTVAIFLWLGLFTWPCSHEKDKMIPIGPDVKASLVIYFRKGASDNEIDHFVKTVLSKPDPHGRGYYSREGVRDVLIIYPPVQGHEGYTVTFFPEATQAQRDELKAAVSASLIVYKVLENVAPGDVKKIE